MAMSSSKLSFILVVFEARPTLSQPAKLQFVDLAGPGLRKRVEKLDPARNLVIDQPFSAPGKKVFRRNRPAGLQNDERDRDFAAERVFHGDGRHLERVRMAVENFIHLARIDVVAAGNNHFLLAVDNEK